MNEAVIATANDYEGLQRAMRVRKETLKLSNATLDAIAGTHDGHAGKMLADPPSKNMGVVSMGLILQALGLKLLIVEDPEQMRRVASQMVERAENQVRNKCIQSGGLYEQIEFKITRRKLRRMAAKGGKARWAKLTPKQRSRVARRAVMARWAKPRP